MGYCMSSDGRKTDENDLDIAQRFKGVKSLKSNAFCETKMVEDRQTREQYVLANVYTHNARHPDALSKEDALCLFDSLRKGKHLNTSTIWNVANSKQDFIFIVQEDM
jgi:hypothetical protein